MSLLPRIYQKLAIASAIKQFCDGVRATLIVMATGTGKTVVAAHIADHFLETGRILCLAHRDELIRQAADKFQTVTGHMPEVEKGSEWVNEDSIHGKSQIIVSSFQTQNSGAGEKKRMHRFDPKEFSLIWCDECFPSGTPIDGRPIESLRIGNTVSSFNHSTGSVELRRITRVFKSRPKSIVTVYFTDGRSIVCTPGHPIFSLSSNEYLPAGAIPVGSEILIYEKRDLHCMQKGFCADQRQANVLAGMPVYQAKHPANSISNSSMQGVWGVGCVQWAEGEIFSANGNCLLLDKMPRHSSRKNIFRDHESDQSTICVGSHEGKKSDAIGNEQGKGFGDIKENWARPEGTRRKWGRDDKARAGVLGCNWLASHHRRHEGYSGWISNTLQDRRGEFCNEGGSRDRREFPSHDGGKAAGSQERFVFAVARVDRVSIHKPADRRGCSWLCPDGFVYNIEVEGNHNYFANGVLVHNCHHLLAPSYRAVIDYYLNGNPDIKLLGVTATPDRADGETMGQIFQSVAHTYDLPDAISDGYLVPVRQRSVVIDGLDFSKVRTTAGDLNALDLEAAMIAEKPLHGVAHATIEVACGLEQHSLQSIKDEPNRADIIRQRLQGKRRRPTLIFTVTVAHALRMAEILNRWIPDSATNVDGETPADTRKARLADFSSGKIQFLVNCMIATEGYDEPRVELVVMARPTKSRPLFTQMAGRGTRPLPELAAMLGKMESSDARRFSIKGSDKPFVEILDFVGNSAKHKLISTADILGTGHDADVIERARELSEEQSVDVSEAIEQAEQEVEEDRKAKAIRDEEELARLIEEEDEKRIAETARRLNLVATTNYHVSEVDAFDEHAIGPQRVMEASAGGASDKQIELLAKLGVQKATAAKYGKRQASAVIESLKAKRCTIPQGNYLRRVGYSEEQIKSMNFDAASQAIEASKMQEARVA